MADYTPLYDDLARPGTLSGTVTGGQLVIVSGDGTIAAGSAATAAFCGVAGQDGVSGDKITIYYGGVQRLVATGTVTAGQAVEAATAGTVATHTNGTNDVYVVGVALTTATAGNLAEIAMNR